MNTQTSHDSKSMLKSRKTSSKSGQEYGSRNGQYEAAENRNSAMSHFKGQNITPIHGPNKTGSSFLTQNVSSDGISNLHVHHDNSLLLDKSHNNDTVNLADLSDEFISIEDTYKDNPRNFKSSSVEDVSIVTANSGED